jgi:hypothetical protein
MDLKSLKGTLTLRVLYFAATLLSSIRFMSCRSSPNKVEFRDPGRLARLSWLWEYKRKERKIPKKEREKEKKEGFPDLLVS